MFDVQTPLNILHRRSLSINDVTTMVARPGLWVSLRSDGKVENITDGTFPAVPKVTLDNLSSNQYESADVRGGRVLTVLEGSVIVKIDSASIALVDSTSTPIVYAQGDLLTVAYDATGAGAQVLTADLGKLVKAVSTNVVVAKIEMIPATGVFVIQKFDVPQVMA